MNFIVSLYLSDIATKLQIKKFIVGMKKYKFQHT